MVVDFLGMGLVIVALTSLAILFFRKLPVLRSLDLQALQLKHASRKEDLITQRLERKLRRLLSTVTSRVKPVWHNAQERFAKLVERVERLELEYRKKLADHENLTPEVSSRLPALLQEAENFQKAGEYDEAEQKYIEAISLSPKHAPAFESLGHLYLEKKELDHALESFRHAQRLAPASAGLLLDVATVYRSMGDRQQALHYCQEAVGLAPNDPKTLDALVEVAIESGDRSIAQTTLQRLREVNPENKKLRTFQRKVRALS